MYGLLVGNTEYCIVIIISTNIYKFKARIRLTTPPTPKKVLRRKEYTCAYPKSNGRARLNFKSGRLEIFPVSLVSGRRDSIVCLCYLEGGPGAASSHLHVAVFSPLSSLQKGISHAQTRAKD